jgi:hypothetical protein
MCIRNASDGGYGIERLRDTGTYALKSHQTQNVDKKALDGDIRE